MKTLNSYFKKISIFLAFCVYGISVAGENHNTSLCRNAIYLEGLGQGILYSINYDYRIEPEISFRVGFTKWTLPTIFFLSAGNLEFTGFPIMVNYLTGKGASHLELGIGVMPFYLSMQGNEIFLGLEISGRKNFLLGTATIGYRFQPSDGGVVFRIGLTPLFTFKDGRMNGGISLGYAF